MSEYSKTEHGNEASVVKLREVMDAREVYNHEHSLGSMLGSALAGLAKELGGESEDEAKRKSALANALKAKDAASGLGLELDFGTNKGITMFAPTEAGKTEVSFPPELKISVVNGEALFKFLKKIDKVDFEKHPDLKNDILIIIKDAARQIANPESTEEKISPLVTSGTKILHEFERLGFGKDTENLAESLMAAQSKTLNELRVLKEAQCLVKPDAKVFGPSDWHKDMSPKRYEEKWAVTKRAVLESLQNKNAAVLARAAVENLIANADQAIKNMEEDDKSGTTKHLKTCQKYKVEYQDMLSKMEEPELN